MFSFMSPFESYLCFKLLLLFVPLEFFLHFSLNDFADLVGPWQTSNSFEALQERQQYDLCLTLKTDGIVTSG